MNQHISKILDHQLTGPTLIGVGSFGLGVVVGYFFGLRRVSEFVEIRDDIDFNAKEAFSEINEPKTRPDPVIIDEATYAQRGVEFIAEHLGDVEIKEEDVIETEVEVISTNVFAGTDDDWDYDEETKNRSTTLPYVLHKDEFYAEEKDYIQTTLTYYAGDKIMVDQEDSPLYNHELFVGKLKFGHGSGDPHVFYVRNDKHRAEYEILFDPGLYSVEVLGLEIENNERAKDLKHSAVPKFRSD